MSEDLIDSKSTLVQVMALVCVATSHYLKQCWPWSLMPYDVINTEMERSSGWQPWYSLQMLKTSFNISSEYQGCHPEDLSISVRPQSLYPCTTKLLGGYTGFTPSVRLSVRPLKHSLQHIYFGYICQTIHVCYMCDSSVLITNFC